MYSIEKVMLAGCAHGSAFLSGLVNVVSDKRIEVSIASKIEARKWFYVIHCLYVGTGLMSIVRGTNIWKSALNEFFHIL
ncbi:hypothetical protein BD408DRAFT_411213 [Parasitella parasitica]|nr:hypothetical protein BD408DRAFT_411213 [Parasitella parasitica]